MGNPSARIPPLKDNPYGRNILMVWPFRFGFRLAAAKYVIEMCLFESSIKE